MEKKLYYQLSDDNVSKVVMELSGCMEWIKSYMEEQEIGDEDIRFMITPIWLTEEEFDNLPEADL